MEPSTLATLSDEELRAELKKLSTGKKIDGFLIGILIGIAIYSAAKNGSWFATILPLFFVFLFLRKRRKVAAIQEELTSRKAE
jgi:hypothetical protein